jgi:MinD-like ATPase involved in chromosome partitioning or flagellar assembly
MEDNTPTYEGIIVARANTIEQISAPFRRGKESPIIATLTVSTFDVEQLANILPSTGASFLMVDFHLDGVNAENLFRIREKADYPVCLIALVEADTNKESVVVESGLDKVYNIPFTPGIIHTIKREVPTAIKDTQANWGKGAWNIAPDMIRKAAKNAGGAPWERHKIGVWSPKCGVGKTFQATELGVALSGIGGRSCVLVDANMNGGHVKLRLGFDNHDRQRGIVNAANIYKLEGGNGRPEAIKKALAEDMFIKVGGHGNLDLLAGVDSMIEAQHDALATEAGYQFAQDMMDHLRRHYEFVIVDLGSSTNVGVHRGVLIKLDTVLIIAEPGLTSINDSRTGANLLEQIGIPRDDIKLVVNKWLPDVGLSLKASSASANLSVAGLVPFDTTGNVTRAENEGISYVAKHASMSKNPPHTQKTLDGIIEIASRFYPPIGFAWNQRKTEQGKKGLFKGLWKNDRS